MQRVELRFTDRAKVMEMRQSHQVEAPDTCEVDLVCLSAFGAELRGMHSQAELGNE